MHRLWFSPSLKERLGGQGKGRGRGSLRAADPPTESSWEPLAVLGALGVRALWGRAVGPRGAGTSRDVLLGAARGSVQVLVLWGGGDAHLAVPVATLWGRGGALVASGHGSGFSTPWGRGCAGQDGAGSQRAASWAGQDPSRALGKGGRGLRGRSWPPLGSGRGPFGVGRCSEGTRGMPVACPRAGAVTVAPGNFQYCKKILFFCILYCCIYRL